MATKRKVMITIDADLARDLEAAGNLSAQLNDGGWASLERRQRAERLTALLDELDLVDGPLAEDPAEDAGSTGSSAAPRDRLPGRRGVQRAGRCRFTAQAAGATDPALGATAGARRAGAVAGAGRALSRTRAQRAGRRVPVPGAGFLESRDTHATWRASSAACWRPRGPTAR